MFDKIISVTPNPSLDVALWIDSRELEVTHEVLNERVDAGGKAINVSRALNSLGQESKALGFAGKRNVGTLESLLNDDKTPCAFKVVSGKIRENIIVNVEGENPLKVNRKGFSVTKEDINELLDMIKAEVVPNTLVHFGGSLPDGFSVSDYIEMINEVSKIAKVSVDTAKLTIDDYKKMKLYLIKPNLEETAALLGHDINGADEAIKAAKELLPYVENVMISLGGDGMLLVNENGEHTVKAAKVEMKSTVGAGDTSIAGFLYAKQQGMDDENALKFAAACGSASVQLEGTQAITLDEAKKVLGLM